MNHYSFIYNYGDAWWITDTLDGFIGEVEPMRIEVFNLNEDNQFKHKEKLQYKLKYKYGKNPSITKRLSYYQHQSEVVFAAVLFETVPQW